MKTPLRENPGAFSFSKNEDVSVQEFLICSSLSDSFSLPLSTEAHQEVRKPQNEVRDIVLQNGVHDTWSYDWGNSFTPSLFYNYCFRDIIPHKSFLWLWDSKCTPKLKFFCWLVLSDRINTRNMLRRRHYKINTGYECLMCDNPPEETIEHMIFHYPFSKICWSSIGMHWSDTGDRLQIVEQGQKNWHNKMFMEIFIVGAWSIWKERNAKLFNQITPDIGSWKRRFTSDFSLLEHRTKKELHSFIHSFCNSIYVIF